MVGDEQVAPALSTEEWSTEKALYHVEDGPNYVADMDITIGPSGESVYVRRRINDAIDCVGLHGDEIPAVIALANHALPDGHPLKITRAKVDAMESLLGMASMFYQERPACESTDRDFTDAEQLIAALRALLPPADD